MYKRKDVTTFLIAALTLVSILAFGLISYSPVQAIGVEGISEDTGPPAGSGTGQPVSLDSYLSGYEKEILDKINHIRVSSGLGPLEPNAHLSSIADLRSSDMLSRGYFSHYTPEGTNIFNILQANGVTYRNAGENLAHSRPADIGSADAFMQAWMASPTHRQNILRDVYGMIGIGEVNNGSRRVVTTVFRNG